MFSLMLLKLTRLLKTPGWLNLSSTTLRTLKVTWPRKNILSLLEN